MCLKVCLSLSDHKYSFVYQIVIIQTPGLKIRVSVFRFRPWAPFFKTLSRSPTVKTCIGLNYPGKLFPNAFVGHQIQLSDG
jgi:hypothetical protein